MRPLLILFAILFLFSCKPKLVSHYARPLSDSVIYFSKGDYIIGDSDVVITQAGIKRLDSHMPYIASHAMTVFVSCGGDSLQGLVIPNEWMPYAYDGAYELYLKYDSKTKTVVNRASFYQSKWQTISSCEKDTFCLPFPTKLWIEDTLAYKGDRMRIYSNCFGGSRANPNYLPDVLIGLNILQVKALLGPPEIDQKDPTEKVFYYYIEPPLKERTSLQGSNIAIEFGNNNIVKRMQVTWID